MGASINANAKPGSFKKGRKLHRKWIFSWDIEINIGIINIGIITGEKFSRFNGDFL